MEMPTLRLLRQRRALSQEDLAKKSGVALSTIIRAEKGNSTRYVTVRRLAEALEVKPEAIAHPVGDTDNSGLARQ